MMASMSQLTSQRLFASYNAMQNLPKDDTEKQRRDTDDDGGGGGGDGVIAVPDSIRDSWAYKPLQALSPDAAHAAQRLVLFVISPNNTADYTPW